MAAATSRSSGAGSPRRSGGAWRALAAITYASPSPNGCPPSPAYAISDPHANTSPAGLVRPSKTCSGAIQPGVPMTMPALVWRELTWVERASPKSITRGPASVSITLAGLRSRCTSPAAWIAVSAAATPTAAACSTDGDRAPCSMRWSSSEMPSMYSVTR